VQLQEHYINNIYDHTVIYLSSAVSNDAIQYSITYGRLESSTEYACLQRDLYARCRRGKLWHHTSKLLLPNDCRLLEKGDIYVKERRLVVNLSCSLSRKYKYRLQLLCI